MGIKMIKNILIFKVSIELKIRLQERLLSATEHWGSRKETWVQIVYFTLITI